MREPITIKNVEDVYAVHVLWGDTLTVGGYSPAELKLLSERYGPIPPDYRGILTAVQVDKTCTNFQFYSPILMPNLEPDVQMAFDYHEDTIDLVECAAIDGEFISICFDAHRFGRVYENHLGFPFPSMNLLGRNFREFFFTAIQLYEFARACEHGEDLLARFADSIKDLPIEVQANWYAHGEVLLLG